jgi:hypothetical protein
LHQTHGETGRGMLYVAYERQSNALQIAKTAGGSALRALSVPTSE